MGTPLLAGALLLTACGAPLAPSSEAPAAQAQAASSCAGGDVTDVFVTPPPPKTDLLFCLAPSPEMAARPGMLQENLRNFIRYVPHSGEDVHLAVVMPDGSDESALGHLLAVPGGGEQFLSNDMPELEARFMALVDLATAQASGDGRCFAAIENALAHPPAGFLRDGALLSVIAISDLREESDRTALEYVSRFYAIKGFNRPDLFSFSAIARFDGSCLSAEDGRYAFMVEHTKGVKGEVCTEDWTTTLEAVEKAVYGYRSEFLLSQVPDLWGDKALEVQMTPKDGRPRPQPQFENGNRVWRYDSLRNALLFEPAYVPGPNQTVTVTYAAFCSEG